MFCRRWLLSAVAVALLSCVPSVFGQSVPLRLGPPPFEASWRHALFVQPVLLSEYNRVDGIVQSLNVRGRLPLAYDRPPLVEAFGRLDVHASVLPHYHVRGGSFGMISHLPQARLGATHGIWANVSAEYHKKTASPDDWIVGSAENSIAALFTRDDYKNYFLIEGYAIMAALSHVPRAQTMATAVNLEWHGDRHRPLESTTNWGLVPLERSFRPNIAATPGRERMLRMAAAVTIQDAPRVPYRTLRLGVTVEKAGGSLGGDFEFDGAFVDLHGTSRTVGNQSLAVRAIAGGRSGHLHPQHILRLGGIGTLRGVPHQRLAGNRMWMVNAEYRLGGDLLRAATFFPFNNGMVRHVVALLDAGFLYDAGTAYEVCSGHGVLSEWFSGTATDNWGIFLSVAADLLRIEWATTKYLGDEHAGILRLRLGLTL